MLLAKVMCFYTFPDFHLSDVRVKVHFFERPRPRRLRAKFEQIATHAARQTEGKTYLKRVLEKLALQG